MISAIPVLGPPAAGKTALLRKYPNVIHLGGYAENLPETDPLKERCRDHWKESETFSPDLLRCLLNSYPLPLESWAILDGTPRNVQQLPVVQEFFRIIAYVIITVDDLVWEERAFHASAERVDRQDSTIQKILARKKAYETEITSLSSLPRRYYLDNSGDFDHAQQRLDKLIIKLLSEERKEETHGRIYGHR